MKTFAIAVLVLPLVGCFPGQHNEYLSPTGSSATTSPMSSDLATSGSPDLAMASPDLGSATLSVSLSGASISNYVLDTSGLYRIDCTGDSSQSQTCSYTTSTQTTVPLKAGRSSGTLVACVKITQNGNTTVVPHDDSGNASFSVTIPPSATVAAIFVQCGTNCVGPWDASNPYPALPGDCN